jgi:hypothetical protein
MLRYKIVPKNSKFFQFVHNIIYNIDCYGAVSLLNLVGLEFINPHASCITLHRIML